MEVEKLKTLCHRLFYMDSSEFILFLQYKGRLVNNLCLA